MAAVAGMTTPAFAGSAPDAGRAFDPPPLPDARYSVRAPTESPDQVRVLRAADGVPLYTETWLPGRKEGGPTPPNRLPVILVRKGGSRARSVGVGVGRAD